MPCMQLRVTRPSAGGALCGVYPVGGGIVSGSGGQEVLEESGATSAFDDHKEHRWIDAQVGTAVLITRAHLRQAIASKGCASQWQP